jgi:hypothetical protein
MAVTWWATVVSTTAHCLLVVDVQLGHSELVLHVQPVLEVDAAGLRHTSDPQTADGQSARVVSFKLWCLAAASDT